MYIQHHNRIVCLLGIGSLQNSFDFFNFIKKKSQTTLKQGLRILFNEIY